MRLFRKQLTRRNTPPHRLSSSSATTDSKSSDYTVPSDTTFGKLPPKMAVHELDLRPKHSQSSSSQSRPSASEGNPYVVKRPTLDDILADRSPPPWTFKAFDRYCSHNLCSENLHFVLDAGLYTKLFKEWREAYPEDCPESAADFRTEKLNGIWKRLIRDYITRNAPKEVNLPANVRDSLANIPESAVPPDAKVLKPCIEKVRELMEESILLSFLNDRLPHAQSDENLNAQIQERPHAAELRSRSSNAMLPSTAAPTAASLQAAQAGKPSGGIFHKRAVSTTGPPSTAYSLNSGRPKSLFSVKEKDSLGPTGAIDEEAPSTPHLSSVLSPPGSPQQRRLSPFSNPNAQKEVSAWRKLGSKLGLTKKPSGSMRKDDSVFEDEE